MNLADLGWNGYFEEHFAGYKAEFIPARVARIGLNQYLLYSEVGELLGELTGKFLHQARKKADFPAVGDWVAVAALAEEGRGIIHAVLPRASRFSRKLPGEETLEQVVAANIDHVFIVTDCGRDFNERRLERYIMVSRESGVDPVIVINKADLTGQIETFLARAREVAGGAPVVGVSAALGTGFEQLDGYLTAGRTVALLGSSGVGKSTIINALLGEERLATGEIRETDGRGRHTTTAREMVPVPQGALLIDNPGIRELQIWTEPGSLTKTFEDIEGIARGCRFRNCSHGGEPGCAVREAVETGALAGERMESYLKLRKEAVLLGARQDVAARQAEKRRGKRRQDLKEIYKRKGK